MEKGFENLALWVHDIFSDSYAVAIGFLGGIFGVLLPIKDPINLLMGFFIIDSIVGYWKNRKLYKQKFSKRKIFETTIPRMIAVVTLMVLLFLLDVTFHQNTVRTYFIAGYFIGGVLVFNIGKNFYAITDWTVFLNLLSLIDKDVERKTGMKVNEKEKKNEKHSND